MVLEWVKSEVPRKSNQFRSGELIKAATMQCCSAIASGEYGVNRDDWEESK